MDKPITRFTIDVPSKLHRDFKLLALQKRKSMRQLALDMIQNTVIHELRSTEKKGNKYGTE